MNNIFEFPLHNFKSLKIFHLTKNIERVMSRRVFLLFPRHITHCNTYQKTFECFLLLIFNLVSFPVNNNYLQTFYGDDIYDKYFIKSRKILKSYRFQVDKIRYVRRKKGFTHEIFIFTPQAYAKRSL